MTNQKGQTMDAERVSAEAIKEERDTVIGTFTQEHKNSITGAYFSESVQVTTISNPINIRGKSSSGNWYIDYSSTATNYQRVRRVYFARKQEATAWIREVLAL